MSSDVVDVTAEFAVARQALWEVLLDPQSYPRLWTGIGGCERVSGPEGDTIWQVRIGDAAAGVRRVALSVRIGRWYESFELNNAESGSFALIRLAGDQQRTTVSVTVFAAPRLHPALERVRAAETVRWIKAGLRRAVDVVRGARTSVVGNGDRAPIRRKSELVRWMASSGLVAPPVTTARQLRSLYRWGFNLAGGYAAGAAHSPDQLALIDTVSTATFAETDKRTTALAGAMYEVGLRAGDAIGLLAANHCGMVETMVAAGKLGVDVALLNAGLSGRRIEEIVQRHRLSALFVDTGLNHLVQYLHDGVPRFVTDDLPADPARITIEDLIAMGHKEFPVPTLPGRQIVLTSGTSGTPKGARRPHPKGFDTLVALLSRIPIEVGSTMMIPAPLFHTWGLSALQLSTAVRATVVLAQGFDAEECLRQVAEHRVRTLIAVPTMIQRLVDLPDAVRTRHDLSSLRHVISCGAPLVAATVDRFLRDYGDVLYNLYGSTEVSWASVAAPEDLRAAPTTAGRPPLGTRIAILGADNQPVPRGVTGRIFVGNHMLFDGYVNDTPPEEADGMLNTGDLGYLDAEGRLFVAGRDDEMIISGGENVFPRPVEEALSYLPQVSDVAVVGVSDREFGQRLAAFLVKHEGSSLDSDMVRTYVRNRLSRFSVPRDVTFLNSLPRGETGKVLKRLLVDPAGFVN
ncbi:acyl-CoA synthetase [Nocardia asteroides NBRC 15531]|uniref:Fatty-acid--CoA ligase n=1 Tax=Nocardia asteroides NBRC 15531 TaxID=1110697 RepID=U5EJM4_NOCAS|nr:AMP-binding protein [Nocardia asteroides]TLF66960.1 acyl-CoA synthetase [Nocardia asteroides NBRC 15531]UGT51785.1 AMP-binding protein [Nocardia asteroides]SFM16948.1 Acyl-CoA synthetase (AMP-forming)/AMP-acid ligase II [Nocardia asteroides]VEG35304.1 Short-chain-fatty-acid--CoA ligase [Nocardia asteroides]GAD86538.1 putative fatty-acid--CoA ligase [Nocardia asteroides NBRC 15531]